MGRYNTRNMMRDRARSGRSSSGRANRSGDYNSYDYEEYDDEYDGRRGVKGTGRYGIGGSRYYGRDRAYGDMYDNAYDDEDYGYEDEIDTRRGRRRDYGMNDYNYDGTDYARGGRSGSRAGRVGSRGGRGGDRAMYDYGNDEMRLSKRDIREWKENMENADGTDGAHFELPQIEQAFQQLNNPQMRGYDLKELCLTANMLYSDYCKVLEQMIPREKEAMIYVKLAKAFLEDTDATLQGSEKLFAYYQCIVKEDEE